MGRLHLSFTVINTMFALFGVAFLNAYFFIRLLKDPFLSWFYAMDDCTHHASSKEFSNEFTQNLFPILVPALHSPFKMSFSCLSLFDLLPVWLPKCL